MAETTYDSTKESLQTILRTIADNKLQLPDFQRGWIWDDDHIRSLLASLSLSYPIGAVMVLETGNPQVRFKPRPVEGAENANGAEPEHLILDGQQRLTSLFQALYVTTPVNTRDYRKRPIKRHYYIDIAKAVSPNGDRDDAIVGIPEDRVIHSFRNEILADYSTPEKEYHEGLFPLYCVFDSDEWRCGFEEYWDYEREKVRLWNAFNRQIIKRFEQYQVPVIILKKPTPKVAVCQVFEKVNTGGVSLTAFELLTASFAADNFDLREDWRARSLKLRSHAVLRGVANTDFLQVIALLATRRRRLEAQEGGKEEKDAPGISCKREAILALTVDEYTCWADTVTEAFVEAAKFLHTQKVFTPRDVPYRTQLVPLAAILTVLGDEIDKDGVRARIARWYWCGVFGELYGSAIETRFARDLPEVVAWVLGKGGEPGTVTETNFVPGRLLTLRTRNSAAYKGLYALLLRDGGLDLHSGVPIDVTTYMDERIDIHHIFPKKWCGDNAVDPKRCDCIVNKTPLSAKTNRIIGGNAPSEYLPRLMKNADIAEPRMRDILASHVMDADTLFANDFEAFFERRTEELLGRIEGAMGKAVARGVAGTPEGDEADDVAEDEDEFNELEPE
ncbi:MAG: GmrSD restriction endonuclease domain-containing protein [Planctomycetota bacterium]